MEPRKEDIQKWCEALRSGEYSQTHRQLQNQDGWCCLGVAAELFIPKDKQVRDGEYLRGGTFTLQNAAPQWLDNISNAFLGKTGKSLITLNDNVHLRLSFDEIADLLEAVYIHEVLK